MGMPRSAITLCIDEECPMHESCYRYIPPSEHQTQAVLSDTLRKGTVCPYYWPRSPAAGETDLPPVRL